MRRIHAIWGGQTAESAVLLVRWVVAAFWQTPAFPPKPPAGLGFAMPASHLSAAVIAPLGWWPVVATALALVGYLAYRYAVVWRQLCQTKAVWEAERRRLNATLESLFDPHAVLQPVRNETGRIVDFLFDDANPAACGWVGMDRDHLKASRLLELYPSI